MSLSRIYGLSVSWFHCFIYLSIVSIYSNTACSVAGITSDANVLTTYLREVAQWSVEKKIIRCDSPSHKECACYVQVSPAVPGVHTCGAAGDATL